MSTETDDRHSEPRHPIRIAADRTGLSPEVLRAWERRYQAVVPGRGVGGQRLYSDFDIIRLATLSKLAQRGRAVSGIALLSTEDLERLAAEDADQRVARPSAADPHRARVLIAVREMDLAAFSTALRRAALSLGTPEFLEGVLGPVITELGDDWHTGRIGIAQEHAASVAIEQLLGWLVREFGASPAAPRVVLATPSGERHALGSMIAAAMAAHDEWHAIWLGVDLPVEQIAAAAERQGADAVAVGVVASNSRQAPRESIVSLRAELPSRLPLLVGGSAAPSLDGIAGVSVVRDLTHWRALLRRYAPPTNG